MCSLSAQFVYFILAQVNCREIRDTLASKKKRVYMIKRMTGEHKNDFKIQKSMRVLGMFHLCGNRCEDF